MADNFITEDFLLQSKTAKELYHQYAADMPIYDYHCHLSAKVIAEDKSFDNLTEAWLAGDHYKWRAMRTNGVAEEYITGGADDYEKFKKWAETVPYCLGNPLYHWSHLELKRYFKIDTLLSPDTAERVYNAASEMLRSPHYSVHGLMRKMNVVLVCTTEGPLDTLEYHQQIKQSDFEVKVHTAFRPDAAMAAEDTVSLNDFIDKLEACCDMTISSISDYVQAMRKRHDYFHQNGCRLSDYGLLRPYAADYTEAELKKIFEKIRAKKQLTPDELLKFKSAMLYEFVVADAEAGWVMQLHIGAIRNNCTRLYKQLGPDIGCDSIGDPEIASDLAKFLGRLDFQGKLPQTILYNLNPKDNAVLATMIGNFQDGSVPGKMQFGSGWWFLDQKTGIEQQLRTLADMGLLSRFVGMLTDSRSFLSYPRHEYFRRVLCNMLGGDVEAGLLPNDMELLGRLVKDICFNNAKNYFAMEL